MVGFNRRFSPHSTWLKSRLGGLAGPLSIAITVNAGRLDPVSWLADRDSGGGRVIGEVCHFVDLVQFLTESTPETAFARRIGELAPPEDDSVLCTLSLANGSIAQISYFAMGDRAHPRERIEVFGAGAVGVIDNFKSARIVRAGRTRSHRNILAVDRGHRCELEVLMNAVRHRCARLSSPSSAAASTEPSTVVPFQEYVSTTLTALALEESLAGGRPEKLGRA
jgi:predicted dehydrogenase